LGLSAPLVLELERQISGGAADKVLIVQGNNTGTYAAIGVSGANALLSGVAVADNLGSTDFNYSPSSFVMASDQLNPTNGWHTGSNQIVDPTATDWTGYYLIWLYK
jgi:hypothetical protein